MDWRCTFPKWKPTGAGVRAAGYRIAGFGRRWLTGCTELLFPSVCLLCGEEMPGSVNRICCNCQKALMGDVVVRCPRCAKPLPKYSSAGMSGCALCHDKRWRFQRAVALGTYGCEVRDLILRIKQPYHEALCLAAGELLGQHIRSELHPLKPDIVAPVPMHWLRKLFRGTNDSEVLAESVAGYLKLPLNSRLMRCIRPTRKQGTLLPNERLLNVRGAYQVRRRAQIAGAHVLVVDDVMTTGATANELGRILKRAGAEQITVAVVARGIGFD